MVSSEARKRNSLSSDLQINEPSPSHIRSDELGCCGDSGEQKGKVSSRCCSETELVTQDVPTRRRRYFRLSSRVLSGRKPGHGNDI
jgi:hypothetical protein